MRARLIFVLPIIFTACGQNEEAIQIERGQEVIRALLNDPASAQFRNVKLVKSANRPFVVCGEVNAKNRMGGYNGFHEFYAVPERSEAQIDPDAEPKVALTDIDQLKAQTAHTVFFNSRVERCDPLP